MIVGVNEYVAETEQPIELQSIDPAAEQRQLERTAKVRAERNADEAASSARSACATPRAEPRTCSSRCATRCARAARSARSAACFARSGASTTANARRADHDADPPRLPDVPGADDPDLGAVRRAARTRAARARPRDRARRARPARAAGRLRFLELRRRVRRAARPDVVWAHFLVPAGLIALGGRCAARRHRARARRAQHRSDSGCRAPDPARRRAGVDRDRRLGVPAPRARGARPGSAREDRGRRLGRRPRAVPAGALPQPSSSRPRSSTSGSLTERKNVVRLADAFAHARTGLAHVRRRRPAAQRARGPRARARRRPRPHTTTCPRGSARPTSSAGRR